MQAGERILVVRPSKRLQPSNAVHLPSIVAASDKNKVQASDAKELFFGGQSTRLITEEIADSMNIPYLERLFEKEKALMKSRALPIHDPNIKKTGADYMELARQSIRKNRLNININPQPIIARSTSVMDVQFRYSQPKKTALRKSSFRENVQPRISPPKNPEQNDEIKLMNRKRMYNLRVATLERCEQQLEFIVRETKKNLHRNMLVLNNLEAKLKL